MSNIILKYFPDIHKEKFEKLSQLKEIYTEINNKINVISRKDIENLNERHVLHSLSILNVINFGSGSNILDVGTGGGFPGVPLAIMFPESNFLLIDSKKQKINAAIEAIKALSLKNVKVKQVRSNELKGKFNFITGRAVTNFPKFHDSVKHLLSKKDSSALPNGILYLKGGDFEEEIRNFKYADVFQLNDFFEEEYFQTKKIIYLPR